MTTARNNKARLSFKKGIINIPKTKQKKQKDKKFVGWDIEKYGKDFYAMPD